MDVIAFGANVSAELLIDGKKVKETILVPGASLEFEEKLRKGPHEVEARFSFRALLFILTRTKGANRTVEVPSEGTIGVELYVDDFVKVLP